MSIGQDSNPSFGAFGWMSGRRPLLKSNGSLSGCGCMPLSSLNLGRPIGGSCRLLTTNYLAGFSQTRARHFGIDKHKRVALVVDQAGWHTSQKVEVPEGIHLIPLPPYSPELQPAERLWTLTNEPVANRSFETLDELEEVLVQRCQMLLKQPEFIRSLTCFHWWPRVAA